MAATQRPTGNISTQLHRTPDKNLVLPIGFRGCWSRESAVAVADAMRGPLAGQAILHADRGSQYHSGSVDFINAVANWDRDEIPSFGKMW